jgi:hypothetical protein
MTQRTKKIRIPIVVDEQGNCFYQGWAHSGTDIKGEDYGAMEEQAAELHDNSFPTSQTTVIRYATIEVPLPEPSSEIPGTTQAE